MKRLITFLMIAVIVVSMVSCGKKADKDVETYYDHTAEQISELLDTHIKDQGKTYKPGTREYALYLLSIERGDEEALKELPQYEVIRKYAFIYTNDIVSPNDPVKLSKDKKVPEFMVGKTIRALAKEDHEKCRDYKSEDIADLLHQRMKEVGEADTQAITPEGEEYTIETKGKGINYKPGTLKYAQYMEALSSGQKKELEEYPQYRAFQKYAFVYGNGMLTPSDPVKLSKDKKVPESMFGKKVEDLAAEIGDNF